MFTEVAPLLIGISEAASNAAANDQLVYGRLRVNCDGWFASLMLAPRLQPFLNAHPMLSLDLIVRDSIGDLVTDGFDMAIRFGEPEASDLVTRKLTETRILTCASPSYLERYGRPLHPSELADGQHQCLLFRDPATGRPFKWEFHRDGEVLSVKVNGRLVLNDVATSLAACTAGLGIAQPMALGTDEMLADGRLVELFPEWNEERPAPCLLSLSASLPLPGARLHGFCERDRAYLKRRRMGYVTMPPASRGAASSERQ